MRRSILILIPFVILGLAVILIPWPVISPPANGTPFTEGAVIPKIFSPVNPYAGISESRQGTERLIGQAWGDYDQDGWFDLYLTDPAGPNLLYRNNGDGTFELAPFADTVSLPEARSAGAIFADYDNDGFPDLYVLNRNEPNVLFHNEGGAGFVDVTAQAGVGDPYDGKTAAWGDYDEDGFLDLYVANWSCNPDCGRPTTGDTDGFYHNNGDGTFTNVTRLLSTKVDGGGFVASFVDYDNDGDSDIYLINDEFVSDDGNALWRNDGAGCDGWCFTDVSEASGANTHLMGMGLATTDYDNDGDFDFYFSNMGPMVLLQNQGDGTFLDTATLAGVDVGISTEGWGTVPLDYDNDGLQDLYLAVSDVMPNGTPEDALFHNRGDGSFDTMTGLGEEGRTMGVAYADYDRDGWVDLVLGDFESGYTLYHNDMATQSDNDSISVRLFGGGPINRDAIGARVYLTTTDGSVQMQELHAGSSLGAGNALELYFGLGDNQVLALVIHWPDGTTQAHNQLAANHSYTFTYTPESPDRLNATAILILLIIVVFAVLAIANPQKS